MDANRPQVLAFTIHQTAHLDLSGTSTPTTGFAVCHAPARGALVQDTKPATSVVSATSSFGTFVGKPMSRVNQVRKLF